MTFPARLSGVFGQLTIRRACLAAILVGMVAGCGVNDVPSQVPPSALSPSPPAPLTSGPGESFTAAASSPSPSPAEPSPSAQKTPRPTPTLDAPPRKPTGVSFHERKRVAEEASSTRISQTVRWLAPRQKGTEIRVFGVTECLARPANPSPSTSGPCLVEHTRVPASVRTLLARAPAADGVVTWRWTGEVECGVGVPAYDPDGPAYYSIVLAAYDASGHSTFAIAEPGSWSEPGPGEIIC